ncbi:hypothetical protein D1007_45249 [Hordeum vulgare]|nr:hypothetical protein D1007_45249 [Hordeum vulgare]
MELPTHEDASTDETHAVTACPATAEDTSTNSSGAPSRLYRAISRAGDVVAPAWETLKFVGSVAQVVVSAMEIARDVRYIADCARGSLDSRRGGDPPAEGADALESGQRRRAAVDGDESGPSVK